MGVLLPIVKRFLVKFAVQGLNKFPVPKNASTELKLPLLRSHPKHVTWNLKESASMLQSLFLSSNHLKNVLTFQLKHVLAPELTQEKFKSQLSRNGVTFQLLNLVLLKFNDAKTRILFIIELYSSRFQMVN